MTESLIRDKDPGEEPPESKGGTCTILLSAQNVTSKHRLALKSETTHAPLLKALGHSNSALPSLVIRILMLVRSMLFTHGSLESLFDAFVDGINAALEEKKTSTYGYIYRSCRQHVHAPCLSTFGFNAKRYSVTLPFITKLFAVWVLDHPLTADGESLKGSTQEFALRPGGGVARAYALPCAQGRHVTCIPIGSLRRFKVQESPRDRSSTAMTGSVLASSSQLPVAPSRHRTFFSSNAVPTFRANDLLPALGKGAVARPASILLNYKFQLSLQLCASKRATAGDTSLSRMLTSSPTMTSFINIDNCLIRRFPPSMHGLDLRPPSSPPPAFSWLPLPWLLLITEATAIDVSGLADVSCEARTLDALSPPLPTPANSSAASKELANPKAFKAYCSEKGKEARCCALPITLPESISMMNTSETLLYQLLCSASLGGASTFECLSCYLVHTSTAVVLLSTACGRFTSTCQRHKNVLGHEQIKIHAIFHTHKAVSLTLGKAYKAPKAISNSPPNQTLLKSISKKLKPSSNTAMASCETEPLINACQWVTKYRNDGSPYKTKMSDCGQTSCKWSKSYMPPQQ
ncbi:hypothetical protein L249_2834 [Ophiocordyceps polyrhachis-furcata BCC 54312]|uniref:Uncharacterized protein n=1 Tax=Ophiocordyceps polyrhachis-furcata BCC 54312 TaxID=1330021 RepID=A0A367LNC8_9HYPO|nr:hypothetical protein L249_2834 [Ophiocordyceps polyrhachis-furcata BCC 54312]